MLSQHTVVRTRLKPSDHGHGEVKLLTQETSKLPCVYTNPLNQDAPRTMHHKRLQHSAIVSSRSLANPAGTSWVTCSLALPVPTVIHCNIVHQLTD